MSEVVPEGWNNQKLGSLAKITDGAHKTPKYQVDGIPFLRVTDIKSTRIDLNSVKYISEEEHHQLCKRCKAEEGDILYSKNGTIGIPKIINWNWEFSIFVSLALIKISEKQRLDTKFLYCFLKSQFIEKQIKDRAKQGTVSNLHLEEINEFVVLLPPLPEQKKIASILTSVDEVIENTQKQIDKLQDLKKATMNELLTKGIGHTEFKDSELGRIPKSWEVVRIQKLLSQSKEKSKSDLPIYSVLLTGGMTPRSSVDRRVESNLSSEQNLFAPKDSLVYNMMRMWQGASGIAPVDCLVSPAYVVCLCREIILPDFLGFLMKSDQSIQNLNRYSQGITSDRLRLYFQHFAEIKFAIPPLDEQSKIIKCLSGLDDSIFEKVKFLSATKYLKKSLMQDLLTGKKRVQVN